MFNRIYPIEDEFIEESHTIQRSLFLFLDKTSSLCSLQSAQTLIWEAASLVGEAFVQGNEGLWQCLSWDLSGSALGAQFS